MQRKSEIIGKRLKEARKKLGKTDTNNFAKTLKSSPTAIYRIERGESTHKLLNKYLSYLCKNGVDLNTIYDIENSCEK